MAFLVAFIYLEIFFWAFLRAKKNSKRYIPKLKNKLYILNSSPPTPSKRQMKLLFPGRRQFSPAENIQPGWTDLATDQS